MSSLRDLSDKAVTIFAREKVSASAAVSKAIEGQGLNREQVHRVSTLANRRIHEMDKESHAGGPMWQSRWVTSKPDEIIKTSEGAYNTGTDAAKGDDPFRETPLSSMGSRSLGNSGDSFEDALDYQLHSIRKLRSDVESDHESGEVEETSHGENDDVDVQPITVETAKELLDSSSSKSEKEKTAKVNPLHIVPSYGRQKTSGIPVDELRFNKLRDAFIHPELQKTSFVASRFSTDLEEASSSLEKMSERLDEYREAVKTAGRKLTEAKFARAEATELLLHAVDVSVSKGGLTLGESLEAVKQSFAHPEVMGGAKHHRKDGWLLDIVDQSFERHQVDVEAATGELRDSRGNLVDWRIKEAQAQLTVRGQVANGLRNLESPLVKASAQYLEACATHEDITEAHKVLCDDVKVLERLSEEAQGHFAEFRSLPDSTIKAMYLPR